MQKSFVSFLIIALVLLSFFSQAQNHQHNNAFGIYVGPNFSNINITSPQLNADSRSGYQAGIYYRSGKFLYGQAGLQFQRMNSSFQMTDSVPEVTDDIAFKRIQVPLYAGLNLIPVIGGIVNIRAYAGPAVSYDMDIQENDLSMSAADFSRFRVDGTVGAGLDILIFSLDAGYTFGLGNLFSDSYDGKCNYAFVNVGLKF